MRFPAPTQAASWTLAAIALAGCAPEIEISPLAPPPEQIATEVALDRFKPQSIGEPIGDRRPWVAHVKAVDLDQDGRMDLVACEAKESRVVWLRQATDGSFVETVIAADAQAPVHVEPYDFDGDGDLDLLLSCMNVVFPNNDLIGALILLENDGSQTFTQRILLENTHRVVDARAADFDKDGDLDIALAQFGYDQGEVSWMQNLGNWEFERKSLLSLSGAINISIGDFNGDGWLDFASNISQQWEEIHLFENDGAGSFDRSRVIWGSTNEDYASSGMCSTDLNRDGRPDLVFTNGDGFGHSPVPGPRPWHGIQWLENKGNGFFEFHRIADLAGAYAPVAADMDQDGDIDLVALSSFNHWSNPKAESLMLYENDGTQTFTPKLLAHQPIQLVTVDAAPLYPGEPPSLFTGGFHAYEPYERMSRLTLWTQNRGNQGQ